MKKYEKLSDNCKIAWCDGFQIKNERYTQVSGYVFNENNELLIVRNEDTWTIPGGHPEEGEVAIDTLNREVMEEACVRLKDIHYLGVVEVVEGNDVYYQLRYTAQVLDVLPFKQEWEICERKFVSLSELSKYIKWANGETFKAQLDSAKEFWQNE